MVYKELKMKFNAAFVHNYPLVHTYFIGSFFFLLQIFLKADWRLVLLFFSVKKKELGI